MDPPVANCFREISELDASARRGSAKASSEEKMLMSSVHPTVNIVPLQAGRKMNIKDTFDFFFF